MPGGEASRRRAQLQRSARSCTRPRSASRRTASCRQRSAASPSPRSACRSATTREAGPSRASSGAASSRGSRACRARASSRCSDPTRRRRLACASSPTKRRSFSRRAWPGSHSRGYGVLGLRLLLRRRRGCPMVDDTRLRTSGGTSRDGLPRRTRTQQKRRNDQGGENDQGGDPASASGHARRLPQRSPVRRVSRSWFDRNRLWLLPYLSALLVVVVEVVAAFTKPLPESAHLVLLAFGGWATQRGRSRQTTLASFEACLAEYAQRRHVPLEGARDEFAVFQAAVRQLPPGERHADE